MPAVEPTRLKFQIEGLMAFFQSPEEFHQCLQDLFSFYANRMLRFGDSTPSKPLIPMYNLPSPVLRQLDLDLNRQAEADPQSALALADELWKDSYLEVKMTAISILGSVPIDSPEPILMRIEEWLSPNLDQALVSRLFSTGTQRLQETFPRQWERFIENLLNQKDLKWMTLGIRGLSEGLKNPEFENLPAVFRLISPIIRNPQRPLFRNLELLIGSLVQRSPTETAYFIRQILSVRESQLTAQLVKQCLHLFPEDIRQEMDAFLRK